MDSPQKHKLKKRQAPAMLAIAGMALCMSIVMQQPTGMQQTASLQSLWQERTGMHTWLNGQKESLAEEEPQKTNEGILNSQQLQQRLMKRRRLIASRIIAELAQEEVARIKGEVFGEELHASAPPRPLEEFRALWMVVDELARWFGLETQATEV